MPYYNPRGEGVGGTSICRMGYIGLYNNQINARALISQSVIVECANKPMEKLCVFWIIIKKQ